jgi:hypothetical protein
MCNDYQECTREASHLHCEDLNCETKILNTYSDKASRRRHYRKNHKNLLRNVGNPNWNNPRPIVEALQEFRLEEEVEEDVRVPPIQIALEVL